MSKFLLVEVLKIQKKIFKILHFGLDLTNYSEKKVTEKTVKESCRPLPVRCKIIRKSLEPFPRISKNGRGTRFKALILNFSSIQMFTNGV